MDALVKKMQYGTINKTDSRKMGYYVINFFSEAYTLQEDTTCDEKIITAGELFFRSKYLICMKYKQSDNGKKKRNKKMLLYQHEKIVHQCMNIMSLTEV